MNTNEKKNKIRHVQTFKTKTTQTKHGKRNNKWKQVVKTEHNTYNKKANEWANTKTCETVLW